MLDTKTLSTALADECSTLRRFLETLNNEQASLTAAAAEQLATITDTKVAQVADLNARTAVRNAALTHLGLPPDRMGLDEAVRRWPELSKAVHLLRQLAAEAAEQNRLNGRLISAQLQGTRDALQVLGVGVSEHDRLYAPGVRTHETSPRTGIRIIDSA